MPIANKRAAVTGIKAAEKDWDRYQRARVEAERTAKLLNKELDEATAEIARTKADAGG